MSNTERRAEKIKSNAHYYYAALTNYLQEKQAEGINFSKIHVFSDGCASQFKNKKNLSRMHEEIMNSFSTVMDILHFFAGSNCFKGVHDGFGGIVKRYIARYILQDNSHAITNAVEMIDALSKKKLGYGEEVRIKRFE